MAVPEYNKYQDMVEGLKTNKDIKGLPDYVNDHVLKVLEKEDQTGIKIIEGLTKSLADLNWKKWRNSLIIDLNAEKEIMMRKMTFSLP